MKKLAIIVTTLVFIITVFGAYGYAVAQPVDTVTSASATQVTPTANATPVPTVAPTVSPSSTPTSTATPTPTPVLNDNSQQKVIITPDSPAYPVKMMIESIQVALTFSVEGKAELLVSFAKERLAEAEIINEKNQEKVIEKIMKVFANNINKANEYLTKGTEEDKNLKAILDEIKVTEQNADKIVIKATGIVPKESVDILKKIIAEQVKKTLLIEALNTAKSNIKNMEYQLNIAKKEYETAKTAGNEALIKTITDKIAKAQQSLAKMQETKEIIQEYKKSQTKENLLEEKNDDKEKLTKQEEMKTKKSEEKIEKEKKHYEKALKKIKEKYQKKLGKSFKKNSSNEWDGDREDEQGGNEDD